MSELEAAADIGAADEGMPLSFEAWADLSARLMGLDRKARLDILYGAGIDVEDWTRCERRYAPAIADDIAHGRMDRARLYAGRCVAETERRRAAATPATPANGVGQDEPAAKRDAGAPLKIGAPLDEGPIDARFLNAPPAPPALEIPPAEQTATVTAFELPTALRGGALPFTPSATPALPTRVATAPLPPPAPPEASGPDGTMVLGATAPLDPAMVQKAALPFAAARAASTPATASKAVAYPRMPLATYAAVCAELTTYPQHTPEIRKRYGIEGDEAQAALDHAWRARLDASAEVRAEWETLVKKHRERLLGQPK